MGTKLVIPPKTKKYTVQKGDTLTGIAKKFGTTVAALKSANNIKDTDKLYIGKVLVVPGGTTVAQASKPAAQPAPSKTTTTAPKTASKPATSTTNKTTTTAQKPAAKSAAPATPINEKAPYTSLGEVEGKVGGFANGTNIYHIHRYPIIIISVKLTVVVISEA